MTRYVVGVDGGKSKTVALIADECGQVLGTGRSTSSDKYDVPVHKAVEAISDSVREAAKTAGINFPLEAGCFGLAGADWPDDFTELEDYLIKQNLARLVQVKNDMHIALHANTDYGIVVSVGTHTAAAIRTPDGEEWHAGWHAVDGPGGFSTGNKILWAVFHAEDGRGDRTILTELVLKKTARDTPLDLLRDLSKGRLYSSTIASLPPLLFEAHNQFRDRVAAQIIISVGKDVASWVTGLLKRYDLQNEVIPVILTGGMIKAESELLMDTIKMVVHYDAPHASIRIGNYEPVIGALYYAFELIDIIATPDLKIRIIETLPNPDFFKTV